MSLQPVPKHLPGIDLLRAVAATSVVVAHVLQTTAPQFMARHYGFVTTLGAWGVGLFFVLSGLCIHLPMARADAAGVAAPLAVGSFFRRRFFRLYPAHLAALLVSIAVAATLPVSSEFSTLLSVPTPGQFVAHLALVHNVVPDAPFTANSVLWTLAVETQFYLAYPLFLALRRRFGTARVVAALFALAVAFEVTRRAIEWEAYRDFVAYGPLAHWWEWALGCLLGERLLARPFAWRGRAVPAALTLASLLAGLALAALPGGIPLRRLVWPIMFGVVVAAAVPMQVSRRPFERVALTVGLASYSLYLMHPVALGIALAIAPRFIHSYPLLVAVCTVAIVIVVAVFFQGVEAPFLRAGKAQSAAPSADARTA